MTWRSGLLDGYSHVVDVLPPTQTRPPLVIVLPPELALPARHWTFNDNGVTLSLLLMLKDWKLINILYTSPKPYIEGSKSAISKELFVSPEEVGERLHQLGHEFPAGYDRARIRMQRAVDNGDISCWLTSSSGRYDLEHGYRNFVPIDELGRRIRNRFIAVRNGKAYEITY